MKRIAALGLRETLTSLRQPALGICLGMQLLFEGSDEEGTTCLGLIPGRARALEPARGRPVPHMGWSPVGQRAHPLWNGIDDNTRFYFAHSYFPVPRNPELVTGSVAYPSAAEPFTCAIGRATLFAGCFSTEEQKRVCFSLAGKTA